MNLGISYLSKQYRRGFRGLRDLDLDLKPGVEGVARRRNINDL
jgi:hypothetical protein